MCPEADATDDYLVPDDVPTYQVLCIDDDPANLRLIRRVLASRTDIRLLLAEGGMEGLLIAETTAPNLVLLDAVMPDLAGIEVARRLFGSPVTAMTPVVVVSGQMTDERRREMAAIGVTEFLDKPWTVAQLLEVVGRFLPARAGMPPA